MSPPAPTCVTDMIWWAFLLVLSILGGLIGLLLKKGIIERLDDMAENQIKFMKDCHKCQEINVQSFVKITDYERLLNVRQEVHGVINGRLQELEGGQRDIATRITMFHDDITKKIERLSRSFIMRDAVISVRLDNLSDNAGIQWTPEKEKAIQDRIESVVADE
jgi:hypothetical protein